jgi:hypothetical protein
MDWEKVMYLRLADVPLMVPYLPDRSPTWHVAGMPGSQAGVSPRI